MRCAGCDTTLAVNGTSTGPPAYGIADADNSKCIAGAVGVGGTRQGCRGNTGEACGANPSASTNPNDMRLSVYQFTAVSGFLHNACVLKLKLLLLFVFVCSRSVRLDDTEMASSHGHGQREGIFGSRCNVYKGHWTERSARDKSWEMEARNGGIEVARGLQEATREIDLRIIKRTSSLATSSRRLSLCNSCAPTHRFYASVLPYLRLRSSRGTQTPAIKCFDHQIVISVALAMGSKGQNNRVIME